MLQPLARPFAVAPKPELAIVYSGAGVEKAGGVKSGLGGVENVGAGGTADVGPDIAGGVGVGVGVAEGVLVGVADAVGVGVGVALTLDPGVAVGSGEDGTEVGEEGVGARVDDPPLHPPSAKMAIERPKSERHERFRSIRAHLKKNEALHGGSPAF